MKGENAQMEKRRGGARGRRRAVYSRLCETLLKSAQQASQGGAKGESCGRRSSKRRAVEHVQHENAHNRLTGKRAAQREAGDMRMPIVPPACLPMRTRRARPTCPDIQKNQCIPPHTHNRCIVSCELARASLERLGIHDLRVRWYSP